MLLVLGQNSLHPRGKHVSYVTESAGHRLPRGRVAQGRDTTRGLSQILKFQDKVCLKMR